MYYMQISGTFSNFRQQIGGSFSSSLVLVQLINTWRSIVKSAKTTATMFLWFLADEELPPRLCANVFFWCTLFLCLDLVRSAVLAVKHLSYHLIGPAAYQQTNVQEQCNHFQMEKAGFAVEISLFIVVILAFTTLWTPRKRFLAPYLLIKMIVILTYIYLVYLYSSALSRCISQLQWALFSLLFSIGAYIIVFRAYIALFYLKEQPLIVYDLHNCK